MIRVRKEAAALVVAASLALLLTACSAPAARIPDLPEQNRARWVQPLDQYTPAHVVAADYAENLLMRPCMESKGFEWNVPWRDVSAGPSETASDGGRRLFTVEIAREFGYHTAVSPDRGMDAWLLFMQQEVSPAKDDAIDECTDVAREQLPRLSSNSELAVGLAGAAFNGALEDSDVVAAAGRWHECMRDSGVPDLPDDPIGIPTEYMVSTFGLEEQGAPTPGEKELATLDATCRETSGYAETLYQEEWERQVTLLADNADALERMLGTITANRLDVFDAIAKNAPRAPG